MLRMKKILVTGGNKGIGLGIVKKLLDDFPDTYLLLGSRDVQRGEAAVKQLVGELGDKIDKRLEMVQLDVCDDNSIKKAVDNIKAGHGELFGLINNAGGILATARETIDLNTYAPISVTEAFLPLIQTPGGRIVQISSAAGPNFVSNCSQEIQQMLVNPEVTFKEAENKVIKPYLNIMEDSSISDDKKNEVLEEIGLNNSGMVGAGYGVSKAGLNAYTMEIARKYPKLLINACTPGFIETDLTRPMAERNGKTPEEMGMKPTSAGATSAVYLMMGDLSGDQTGQYYGSDAVRSPLHKYRSPGDPPYNGEFP